GWLKLERSQQGKIGISRPFCAHPCLWRERIAGGRRSAAVAPRVLARRFHATGAACDRQGPMSPTIDHEEPCPITRPYPQPFPALTRHAPTRHDAITRVSPPRPAADSVTRIMATPPVRALGPLPPPC